MITPTFFITYFSAAVILQTLFGISAFPHHQAQPLYQRKRCILFLYFTFPNYSPDNVLITRSTSLFSSSWMMCRYVFCVVVILACPSLLATLAIDTPAKSNSDACVCLSPWIEIFDIPHSLQCLVRTSFTVEL